MKPGVAGFQAVRHVEVEAKDRRNQENSATNAPMPGRVLEPLIGIVDSARIEEGSQPQTR